MLFTALFLLLPFVGSHNFYQSLNTGQVLGLGKCSRIGLVPVKHYGGDTGLLAQLAFQFIQVTAPFLQLRFI